MMRVKGIHTPMAISTYPHARTLATPCGIGQTHTQPCAREMLSLGYKEPKDKCTTPSWKDQLKLYSDAAFNFKVQRKFRNIYNYIIKIGKVHITLTLIKKNFIVYLLLKMIYQEYDIL